MTSTCSFQENTQLILKKKKITKKNKFLILLILIFACICVYFYIKPQENHMIYITERASLGTIVQKVNATGQIFPVNVVDIGAQVSGQIKKIYVKLGDFVKEGQLLVEIDSRTQTNDLKVKKSQLESLQYQLLANQNSLRTVMLRYEREKKLRQRNATSKESFESVANELAIITAELAQTEASIRQAQLAVDNAQTDLEYTSILAPKEGSVVAVIVEEGQTVNASQSIPTLLQVVDLSHMEIKVEISEGDITKVRSGMPIEFSILSEPHKKYYTTLASIEPAYTVMSNGVYSKSTGNTEAIYYYANALINNKDDLLRIGMTIQSYIIIDKKENVLRVPNLAIEQHETKKGIKYFISILKDSIVERCEVKAGLTDGIYTEIFSVDENFHVKNADEIVISQVLSTTLENRRGSSFSMGMASRMRFSSRGR